jgi:hypothetical protein
MSQTVVADEPAGSWTLLIVVSIFIFLYWISFSQSGTPMRFRRWYNMQRVQLKKKLGMRDESIYREFAAGDGANQRYKRQG